MSRFRPPWSAIVLASFFCLMLAARPAAAFTVYSVHFFSAPNQTCMADHPTGLQGRWRLYPDGTPCPEARYRLRVGGLTHPQKSVGYYRNTDTGFIEIMNEVKSNQSTGVIGENRVFRDMDTLIKGHKWLPWSFSSTATVSWTADIFVEEWVDEVTGSPACGPNTVMSTSGEFHSDLETAKYIGVWPDFIADYRAASADTSVLHDIEVIRRTVEAGSTREEYHYGRWFNPATQSWFGLGLVKYEKFVNNVSQVIEQKRYLVDCTKTAICPTCPP
jgi:hypothetical protein